MLPLVWSTVLGFVIVVSAIGVVLIASKYLGVQLPVTRETTTLLVSALIVGFFIEQLVSMYDKYKDALYVISEIDQPAVNEMLRKRAELLTDVFEKETSCLNEVRRHENAGMEVPPDLRSNLWMKKAYAEKTKRKFWELHAICKNAGVPVFNTVDEHLKWKPTLRVDWGAEAPAPAD